MMVFKITYGGITIIGVNFHGEIEGNHENTSVMIVWPSWHWNRELSEHKSEA